MRDKEGWVVLLLGNPLTHLGDTADRQVQSLALREPESDIENICTNEYTRFHANYWSDELVAKKAQAALSGRFPCEIRETLQVRRRPRFDDSMAASFVRRNLFVWFAVLFIGIGSGYLSYLDRTRWDQPRNRQQAAEKMARIDHNAVNTTGTLRRKFGMDRIGPPDNMEVIEYKVFELTFKPAENGSVPIIVPYGKFEKDRVVFADLHWVGNEAPITVRYLKSDPKEFYLPGEEPDYPEELSLPFLAGAHALLFRAAPLGAIAWLIYATLFGLLKPKRAST